ncbi:MAG TPA: hypothetical protein VJ840_18820 [Gemmatimonadaceae bacterium]|nr:hypothetical protein [Gemmatimonadaceae bacterium]
MNKRLAAKRAREAERKAEEDAERAAHSKRWSLVREWAVIVLFISEVIIGALMYWRPHA